MRLYALPMRRPTCFDGPACAAAKRISCITATTTPTSTVPVRRATFFGGPTRAAAREMWCTTAATTTVSGVLGLLSEPTASFVQRVYANFLGSII